MNPFLTPRLDGLCWKALISALIAFFVTGCTRSQLTATGGYPTRGGAWRDSRPQTAAPIKPSTSLARQGADAIENGDYPAAVKLFSRALKHEPANPHLHYLNGVAYHLWADSGDPSQYAHAAVGYKLALRFDPANSWAAYQLGRIEFERRNYTAAQDYLSQALLVDRDNPELHYALAAASYYAGDVETALSAAQKLQQIHPNSPSTWRAAAVVHAAAGNTTLAQDYFNRFQAAPGTSDQQKRQIESRLQDWQRVHAEPLPLIAQAASPTPALQNTPPPVATDAAVKPARKGPRMVQIDAVLIRSEERISSRKGVNLLDGLKMTFSASPLEWARDLTRPGPSQVFRDQRSIRLSTPDITYSLNIFNDVDSRNEVLAQPSLVATENVQSEFFSGATIHVAITPQVGGYGQLQQIRIGMKIGVTPRFIDEDTIEITATVDRDFIEPAAATGTFEEFVQAASTHLTAHATLRFDETLIVSGLSERETEMTRNGVPFLQSIPGVQYAFSRKDDLKFIKSVLVLLTPRRAHFVEEDGPQLDVIAGNPESENLRELKRQTSWLKPPHNLESVLLRLKQASILKEFRLEDLPLEHWHTPDKLSARLKRALEFLYY